MGLTRAEQETIFRWDEEEKIVHVYSASPVTWRKLARPGLTAHKQHNLAGQVSGKFYRLPLEAFSWGRRRRDPGRVPPPPRARRTEPQEPRPASVDGQPGGPS